MGGHVLKAHRFLKEPVLYTRHYCSVGNNLESSNTVAYELKQLADYSNKNDRKGVDDVVRRLITSQEFWKHCYESIKSNPGSTALGGGVDEKKPKTLDGIDLQFFKDLALRIGSGRFQFGLTRQTFISKSDGSSRPLGIANSRDKIVQKGMAIILEVLSEDIFFDNSFGFRRNKSAHDAINFIKTKVPSGVWAIEGDISKCFDSFDHKRLISIVNKNYVSLQIFLDLIRKAIKVRIVSIHSSFTNKVGTPQGSVVSPILCNIYLHELDKFILQGEELDKFRGKKRAASNWEFTKFIKHSEDELLEAEAVRRSKGKAKYWKFLQKLRVSKIKKANSLGLVRLKHLGTTRKITFVRYADDFVIFVWGTKADCIELTDSVRKFLNGDLALNLSTAKTKITFLKKQKVKFLGFEIWQPKYHILSSKKDINPLGKLDKIKLKSKYRGAVMSTPRIRVTFSMKRVLNSLVDKGLARFKQGKFFPTSYKSVLQYDVANIVNYLRQVFHGIVNYYSFSDNWYDTKSIFNYFGKFCTAMTLAQKLKSKVPKIFKKYGDLITIKSEKGSILASFGKYDGKPFRKARFERKETILCRDVKQLLFNNLKIAKMHMINWNCVICGNSAEMHHIKHVKKTLRKKAPGSFNAYLEAMRIVNRKTLPVCREHHLQIHKGEYDAVSLKSLFESFKEQGIGFKKYKADSLIKKSESLTLQSEEQKKLK